MSGDRNSFNQDVKGLQRLSARIQGQVQGIGFRPFVYRLAQKFHLVGSVRNELGGVQIEAEGKATELKLFLESLQSQCPPGGWIEKMNVEWMPTQGESSFSIQASQKIQEQPVCYIPTDRSTCIHCLSELFDPKDRRHNYPFLNCTECGPRFTLIQEMPYDRERTTMKSFFMCDPCRSEYKNPLDRRYHAQPIACPECGPRLKLVTFDERENLDSDPVARCAQLILQGQIGAVKGLGGYHLICNALDSRAVSELRKRKKRDLKPLAVMVANDRVASLHCEVSDDEQKKLNSPEAPIVLLQKRSHSPIAEEVTPSISQLGLLLPYTPLHHLLMRELDELPLVMTSANIADEPMLFRDSEAASILKEVADFILSHDRPIEMRCDDSVLKVRTGGEPIFVRRSRGFAPHSVRLPFECESPILALGGQMKNTFAIGFRSGATLSHHLGELDCFESYQSYVQAIEHYKSLLRMDPQIIACDLHPDYASTHLAKQMKENSSNIALIPVQHHHAHMASCMAENGLNETVIGVCFDGTGYGTDGTIWGGEFLVGGFAQFHRAGHFKPVSLPGGEKAIEEPWRMAYAFLKAADCDPQFYIKKNSHLNFKILEQMINQNLSCPKTSSVGRLFDAISALCGFCERSGFEAQAAMILESLAAGDCSEEIYPFEFAQKKASSEDFIIDSSLLIRAVVADLLGHVEKKRIARKFHISLAEIVLQSCQRIRQSTGLGKVVLSGGVFLNEILLESAIDRLHGAGFEVFSHRLVPPNDGGLSLGQLAVAHAIAKEGKDHVSRNTWKSY